MLTQSGKGNNAAKKTATGKNHGGGAMLKNSNSVKSPKFKP